MGSPVMVVVGATSPGLWLTQHFGRYGIPVAVIGRPGEIGLRSRYGVKYEAVNASVVASILSALARQCSLGNIYITSEYFLTGLLDVAPKLFGQLPVVSPTSKALRLLTDKVAVYELVEGRVPGVQTLATTRATSIAESKLANWEGPVIVKWNRMPHIPIKQKTWLFPSSDECQEVLNELPSELADNAIVQPFIEGPSLSIGGVLRHGERLASVAVHQVRQWPRGISAYVRELPESAVSKRMLDVFTYIGQLTSYTGFLEVEFRIDAQEVLYVIDVNPRTWGWVKILEAKYKNLNEVLLAGSMGESTDRLVQWRNVFRDARALIAQGWRNDASPDYMLHHDSCFARAVWDIWDQTDPLPFLITPLRRVVSG